MNKYIKIKLRFLIFFVKLLILNNVYIVEYLFEMILFKSN